MIDGSRDLAAAVIQQAWNDSSAAVSHRGCDANRPKASDQRDARAFLLDDSDWGVTRALWCQMAGIDPDALRDRARQRLRVA